MKTKTKVCSRCGEELPIDEFGKNRNLTCGLNAWCRICCRNYQRERYKNPKLRARQKQYAKSHYNKIHRGDCEVCKFEGTKVARVKSPVDGDQYRMCKACRRILDDGEWSQSSLRMILKWLKKHEREHEQG